MGRRGVTAATGAAIEKLRASGTQIEVVAGDVSSAADVRAVLERIAATLPPLRGVFHAAMVLEDGPLAEMDAARFARVMAAKMAGAWHLHQQTSSLDLDAFVLFSSMSSLLGNPQQANYCAANAFLDALAHARRQAGRPAVAINWGVLSDIGYVSQHPGVSDFLARQGYDGFSPQQALDVLEWIMRHDVAQLMAGRVDWRRWAVASASRAASPRMRDLVPGEETPADGRPAEPRDLARHLRGLGGAARVAWVEEYLRGKVARILGASAATLDLDRPLTELGTDSLTAVELTTALGVDLGVEVPLVRVLQGGTTRSLAAAVLEQVGPAGAPDGAGEPGEPPVAAAVLEQVGPADGPGAAGAPGESPVARAAPITVGVPVAPAAPAPVAVAVPVAPAASAPALAVAAAASAPIARDLPVGSAPAAAPAASGPIARPLPAAPARPGAPAARAPVARDLPVGSARPSAPAARAPIARALPVARAWSGRRRWARAAIGLGFRTLTDLRVEGLDHLPAHGPYIVAVNHLSLLDAPLVMSVLPRPATLLAADYLQRSPFGWVLDWFGHAIYVKRGEADRAALEQAIDLLRAGGVLALGPEGTRSQTGGLGRGLSGVALIATEVGVPVVPLVAWGQERMTESWKSLRRAPVQVRIGPPLHFARESAPAAALLAHTERVMRALAALLPLRYRGIYAEPPAAPEAVGAGRAG
jgi:1-acyl-sn-glycerol-3-phosphate acyltransferase